MRPEQRNQEFQEPAVAQVEQDLKEDAGTGPPFAMPQERSDRGAAGASSEAVPEPIGKPITSQRKIEANRRNAQRSTGPRTDHGKRRVSRNALKHGIFSRNLLTNDEDGGEDPREYLQLQIAIRQHYQPEGPYEQLLVDWITALTWRLSRVPRCERGHIDRALSGHRFQIQQGRAMGAESPEVAALANPEDASIVDDLLLPPIGELDKLLRYEEAISRQRDRAIAELERLQAKRRAGGVANSNSEKQSH